MRQRAGVYHDAVNSAGAFLQAVDERALVIGLKAVHGDTKLLRPFRDAPVDSHRG